MALSQHLVGQHSHYADTGLLETHGQTGEMTQLVQKEMLNTLYGLLLT